MDKIGQSFMHFSLVEDYECVSNFNKVENLGYEKFNKIFNDNLPNIMSGSLGNCNFLRNEVFSSNDAMHAHTIRTCWLSRACVLI